MQAPRTLITVVVAAMVIMLVVTGLALFTASTVGSGRPVAAGSADEPGGPLVLLMIAVVLVAAFVAGLGWYLYRREKAPLAALRAGAEAVSRGDLDHRITVPGDGDFARLAERFNEMAERLRNFRADLEHRLLERTRELMAISSVSLALAQSGSITSVLNETLRKLIDSLGSLETRGGVFLCDQDGERLRLMSQVGMSAEFQEREAVISAGECLCGAVARSGKLLYTPPVCDDPRHTRSTAGDGHGHIIIPIKSRGRVFGVIFLYPDRQFTPTASDIQFFDAVGSQLGIALENAGLYRDIKSSGEKYEDLFENSLDLLCTLDNEGRLTAVNRALADFFGFPKAELIGKPAGDLLTEDGAAAVRQTIAGGEIPSGRFESAVTKSDGSTAFLEISVRRLQKEGTPAGFQISARDVTEQKELREKLVRAERLAAIGQVGIAFRHEINNPLTTVLGNAELLLDRYEEGGDAELLKRLQLIADNALRITEIVNRLKQIKVEKTVDYIEGVKMTDLKQE